MNEMNCNAKKMFLSVRSAADRMRKVMKFPGSISIPPPLVHESIVNLPYLNFDTYTYRVSDWQSKIRHFDPPSRYASVLFHDRSRYRQNRLGLDTKIK